MNKEFLNKLGALALKAGVPTTGLEDRGQQILLRFQPNIPVPLSRWKLQRHPPKAKAQSSTRQDRRLA